MGAKRIGCKDFAAEIVPVKRKKRQLADTHWVKDYIIMTKR